jgi:hypothetical protein
MTTKKGSLLGVEPFPLSLGVEGLAPVLCPGFPNPTWDGISAQTVWARSLGRCQCRMTPESAWELRIISHNSRVESFPRGIRTTLLDFDF